MSSGEERFPLETVEARSSVPPPPNTPPPAIAAEGLPALSHNESIAQMEAIVDGNARSDKLGFIMPGLAAGYRGAELRRLQFFWPNQDYDLADIVGESASVHTFGQWEDSIWWADVFIPADERGVWDTRPHREHGVVSGYWGDHVLVLGGAHNGDAYYAWAFGEATGTNPAGGSAAWTGVANAYDFAADARYFGRIDLTAPDLGAAELDVSLHISRHDRPDYTLYWSNVPIVDGKIFAQGLSAWFFGPGHEEVGGWWYRLDPDDMAGSFAASREP